MRFVRQEPAITEWEDMKAKLQDEYLTQYFRAKYLPQSSCGHSQDRKDNLRHRNSQPIAQFEENKVSVHSVSSPTLSPAWWSRLEQHVENLRKIIQDEIKASQKEINNSEVSHTRDISVEPPILSATIEVQDLQVQEEELIVEPKQHVFEDTQFDEVDKVVSFSSPIPHIEFIIPGKFNDVMESKAPLFSVLPTVVPELKQVFRVRLLLLQHYKTRGRVFSNQRNTPKVVMPRVLQADSRW
uniref:Retrotransposon gag domain-containing protein n=1 Tax=Fagus sylvatica TaxID=28930 RepID=A0A2N9HRK7_FAGSY